MVGLPDHARVPMMRTALMREIKLFKSQYPSPSPGKMIAGCRAHGADARDDDIVGFQ